MDGGATLRLRVLGKPSSPRNIKGARFAVDFDRSHHPHRKERRCEPSEVYWYGRSSGNDLGCSHGFHRQADPGVHPGNESGHDSAVPWRAARQLAGNFEEGISAAWLYAITSGGQQTSTDLTSPRSYPRAAGLFISGAPCTLEFQSETITGSAGSLKLKRKRSSNRCNKLKPQKR